MNRTKAQYIRSTNHGQDVPGGRTAPAPAPARPSATFALILALGEQVKAGEISQAEYEQGVEEAKVAQQKAIMAGRF